MRFSALFGLISLVASPIALSATPASAWGGGYQQPQQYCHYSGHYDQNGQLHNDSRDCWGGNQQPQQHWHQHYQPAPQQWHENHWHQRQQQHFMCYDQMGPGWQHFRVCI